MLQRETVAPTAGLDESAARGVYAARARYSAPENAFEVKIPEVPRHVFVEERAKALDPATETGLIPLDISDRLELDFPATTPLLLVRYVRIRPGDSVTTELKASAEVYYVMRGAGHSEKGDDRIPWRRGDAFCLPGGGQTRHVAGETDSLLFLLTNEPQLALENAEPPLPGNAPIEALLYPAEELAQWLQSAESLDGPDVTGKAVVFSSEGQEWRRITPTLTLALASLAVGEDQRPHYHNSVAVTLIVKSDDCYSILDGERVDWLEDAVMLTPPGTTHSHHNRGNDRTIRLVAQDGGLYYHCRTMGFSFNDAAEGVPG